MIEPLAYENGRLVQADQLMIPLYDRGFVQGVTVAEQMRTFRGKLFRLDDHLKRFRRSLEIVDVDPQITDEQIENVAYDLISHNLKSQVDGDDLALVLFVTPGAYSAFAASPGIVPSEDLRPRVVMHTYPLPFGQWCGLYDEGQALTVSSIRQVPPDCWPSELKCRSRMHYFLADHEAMKIEPGSRALLLDHDGLVSEASTANLFAYFSGEGFVAPPADDVLPGISLSQVQMLAEELGESFSRRPLQVAELKQAAEVLLCSTSPCVLPVRSIDKVLINKGTPGPQFQRLIEAWSEKVSVDIVGQAKWFANREELPSAPEA